MAALSGILSAGMKPGDGIIGIRLRRESQPKGPARVLIWMRIRKPGIWIRLIIDFIASEACEGCVFIPAPMREGGLE